jgi:hypothetical protein
MQARQPAPAHTQSQRQKEISRKTDTERNCTSYCKIDYYTKRTPNFVFLQPLV